MMTTQSSSNPRLGRMALGALALVVGLGITPDEAQSQVRSGFASVALHAYAAPAVHVAGTVSGERPLADGGISDLMGISVNTGYRIELRGMGTGPVVLLRQDRGGVVPWDRVLEGLDASDRGPVLLDLVLKPTL
jgi:hypothetical protein